MEQFNFTFDFSELDSSYLQKNKISYSEIVHGFHHNLSEWYNDTDYPEFENLFHFISFCTKYRFLRVYLTYREGAIAFLSVKLADEEEIRKYYCRY